MPLLPGNGGDGNLGSSDPHARSTIAPNSLCVGVRQEHGSCIEKMDLATRGLVGPSVVLRTNAEDPTRRTALLKRASRQFSGNAKLFDFELAEASVTT